MRRNSIRVCRAFAKIGATSNSWWRSSCQEISSAACGVLESRLASGPLACGVLGIGCGILMTSAVAFAKKGKEFGHWVPLLFAVPLFIHCGFPHCIADAFYYLTAADYILEQPQVLWCYLLTVIGNFIGCNIPRIASI